MNTTLYIGEKDTGKTTKLEESITQQLMKGYKIVVIDSACDHPGKSLIHRLQKKYSSFALLGLPCQADDADAYLHTFFSQHIDVQIYLFDVSYYLEKSYDALGENLDVRCHYQQEALKVLMATKSFFSNTAQELCVFMDEVELSVDLLKSINNLGASGIQCLMALHPHRVDISLCKGLSVRLCDKVYY